ncbi:uncharacterized protein LOC114939226 isoform X2 [Nylanderia fulva]|uniref:uncharacterized protein LOC114939226 isoform X2 n=1 Tax=Nylanderia fulva TaxID=613905 RepID=UPI0010FBACEA|nr:uncharacterized protein LOC114939226 isoform X2 [Nylanderia fulva]
MQHKSLSASKSGLTISERRKSLIKILNRQRSPIMIGRKINLSKTSNHVRLLGGADVSEESNAEEILSKTSPLRTSIQEVPDPPPPPPPSLLITPPPSSIKESVDSSPVEESARSEADTDKKSPQEEQPFSTNGPCCFCVPQSPRSVGDRKVDEIIEYVHQNLEEAGKALATLGENFEHDLKVEPHIQLECHKTVSTSRGRKRRGYN